MTGTTRDETKLFTLGMANADLDDAGLTKRLRAALRALRADESRAEAMIETYRRAREGRLPTTPGEIFDALETDRTFRIPAIRLAEAQRPQQPRTYKYLFNWTSPARRGALGACHALELPFVFGTLDAPTMDRFAGKGPDADALAARMMDAWIAFARSGDPGWPAYDAERRATRLFDRADQLGHAPHDPERAAWDGLL
jgi:para-nitrobenzyl esterase